MGSVSQVAFNVKSIAIIGAGPSGLSAAKYLLAEECFDEIVIFEQSAEVGGVWNYSSTSAKPPAIPQTDAHPSIEKPVKAPENDGTPLFPSPMYDHLYTNIPASLMQYGDKSFPDGPNSTIFPSRQVVQEYLVDYGKPVRHLIRFSTQVTSIKRHTYDGHDKWDITSLHLTTSTTTIETYDAVVIASGHYATPSIPPIPNISLFQEYNPRIISHSRIYRSPAPFKDKKVLVIGNAASGLDIAAQISRVCAPPLLLSVRNPTPPDNLAYIGAKEIPEIRHFLPGSRGVLCVDGTTEIRLDAVVFCTGYLYTLPFLDGENPEMASLITDGRRVHGLYEHFINIEHPTLVFPGLPIKVIPFPVSEAQASIFARVWSNRLPLPSKEDMHQWEKDEEQRVRERGKSKEGGFHVFPPGGDGEYLDNLHAWAMSAQGSHGKEPPKLGDELKWQRNVFFEAKLAFDKGGQKARTLEELGFMYEPPNKERDGQDTLI